MLFHPPSARHGAPCLLYSNLEVREPTVKVTTERLPESRVQLNIEIDEDRLERSLDSAYKRIANKNRFPGFRPGKAPRAIVERAVGREGLIREALDKLVPDAYNEAIEAELGPRHLEILELVLSGCTNQEISHSTQLSLGTVKNC